ncbi:MAG TPA: calcium-binding protein [Solirubrobacterales bacterium]|nr:calcium-binding protein [Solirubrobacterales bacterium]
MGRLWGSLVVACVLAALVAASAGAAEAPVEAEPSPAELAAEVPTPSCAEGPRRDGEVIVGTDCADHIVVPATVTYVDGGPGNDVIVGSQTGAVTPCPTGCHLEVGSQTFEGGEGDDLVYGDRGNDILRGNAGDDRLYGGIGDDRLEGGTGDDWVSGGFGADTIDGGEDSDYVRGDGTIDHIFDTGLTGKDTLSFASGVTPGFGAGIATGVTGFPGGAEGERGVYLNLTTGGQNANNGIAASGGGVDEVQQGAFERFIGTPFSDYIVGTGAEEEILGGGGADVIVGGGGADTLRGGADGDYLEDGAGSRMFGEAGVDGCAGGGAAELDCEGPTKAVHPRNGAKVSVGEVAAEPGSGAGPGSVDVYLVGSGGGDTVTATYGAGVVEFALAGGAKFDAAPADAGGCTLGPGAEPTTATCALGAPTTPNVPPLDAILLAGLGGNDTITANGFPDGTGVIELGGEGGDALNGGPSEDVLVDGSGSGADTLNAGPGDDALLHNGGADELEGGAGSDLFLSVSVCDGETIRGGVGGPNDRDNSSWARLGGGGVYANLATGLAGRVAGESLTCPTGTADHLEGITDLEGSEGDDVLIGSEGVNQLLGHAGADTYRAGGGGDTVFANSGTRDLAIDCGEGTDAAVIDFATTVGDPAPVGCENVREGAPNEYRTQVELPPPAPPTEPPPATSEPPPTTGTSGTGTTGTTKPGSGRGGSTGSPKPDRTPPRTKLLAHSANVLRLAHGRRAAVTIRFAASERSHFECKLDARAYRSCRSPFRARLAPGRHAFRVYAIDAAGNRDGTPALLHLRVISR